MSPTAMASRHRAIYIGSIIVLIGLVVAGLLSFHELRTNATANRRADQLAAKLKAAGYTVPSHTSIVRTLGSDGGAVCDDPNDALNRALRNSSTSSGASGPGNRPVINDREFAEAVGLALEVYCPDEAAAYKKHISNMTFSDTVKN